MATQLDICNLALLRLGQGQIGAMTEQSKEAQYCLKFWDADRRASLRDYAWNFATPDPALLALLPNTPVDFAYAYQLPADCLRALTIFNPIMLREGLLGVVDISDVSSAAFDNLAQQILAELTFFKIRKNRVLVTNMQNAYLVYTADITDTSKYDDQFVEALSYRLAIDLALPITANPQFASTMTSLYRGSLLAARKSDAQERKQPTKIGRSFLQARQ